MEQSIPYVAIVDDDAAIRKCLVSMLSKSNMEPVPFADGIAFLNSLHERHPACIVLDIEMPEMNGFEVRAQLRRMGFKIPVIFFTGMDEEYIRAHLTEPDSTVILHKPLAAGSLIDEIERTLENGATAPLTE